VKFRVSLSIETMKLRCIVRYSTERRLADKEGTYSTFVNSRGAFSCPLTTGLKRIDPIPSEYSTDPSARRIGMRCGLKFRTQWRLNVIWAEAPVSAFQDEWESRQGVAEKRALAEATEADWGAAGTAWESVEAGAAEEDDGEAIWRMSFSLRKHLASVWPRREQNSHFGQLEPLFCEFWEEGKEDDEEGDEGSLDDDLEVLDEAEKAEVVPARFERVCSMFLSDWITDCLSNLSRTEIVRMTSSKECGSALMMAITASSS
jgi:hypothetical protein